MSTYINLANRKDNSRLGRKQKTFSSFLANLCQLVPSRKYSSDSNYTGLLLFWQVRTGGRSLLGEEDRIPDALDQSKLILPNNLFSRTFAGFQLSRSLCRRDWGFDFSLSKVFLYLYLLSQGQNWTSYIQEKGAVQFLIRNLSKWCDFQGNSQGGSL